MSRAAYTSLVDELNLPDLLRQAEDVKALDQHPGWALVTASIDAWREKLLAQLLNPSAKPQDVDRLRGEIRGLLSAREAAASIVGLAEEREAVANKRTAQELANV